PGPGRDRGDTGAAGHRQHRAGRLAALHELSDPVRGRVDAAAGGDDRRNRAGEARAVTVITPTHYMLLSAALFIIGVIGVMVRRNIIIIFMSIELILNAVNINLIAFSYQLQKAVGKVFAIFLIAVATERDTVGLA